jgi:hypothetical protein
MDIQLRIDGHHCHSVGFFTYQHFKNNTEKGTIWLHGVLCNVCNKHLLKPEDYCDILEHEHLELFASRQHYLDTGECNWNAAGFNKIIYKVIKDREAIHRHGDKISSVKYMGWIPHQ